MGREADAVVHWQGRSGPARVLLETSELILRGALKGRVSRGELSEIRVEGDTLAVVTLAGPLRLVLGAKTAQSWATALQKPPPTLAEKLGLTGDRRACVIGEIGDAALQAGVAGRETDDPERADILIAVIRDAAGLDAATNLAARHPALPLWCVYAKGKAADPGDAAIRSRMRAAGRIDLKTSGVSEDLTATRYDARRDRV